MWAGAGVAAGAVLAALAGVGMVYWPTVYHNQLAKRLVLTNTSMSYEMWRETPIPMYLEIFMWHCTNADEVLASHVKPNFTQMGPYVFREVHIKTNVSWHAANSTVTFHNNRTWHFEPQLSSGALDDNVTNVNVVIASTAYAMRLRSVLLRPLVNAFLVSMHEHLFTTARVRDWLFQGIDDPVIDWALAHDIPTGVPFDRFGWFYGRNGSELYDGSFNMDTGAAELARLGEVRLWRDSARTPYRDHCGDVRGSTGELWPPLTGQDTLTIFASDLCTYMELSRAHDISVLDVPGTRFVPAASVFDNGHREPSAACYCAAPPAAAADCVPRGALNVSDCRYGAPAFVTFPHFYDADPVYLTKVDGLTPDKEQHEFRVGLELGTGIPLEVRAQLQINLLLRHVGGLPIANALPDDTLVPMFWFRQEVRLTPDFAAQARLALALRSAVQHALLALLCVGVVVLGASSGVLAWRLARASPAAPDGPLVRAEQPPAAEPAPAPAP